MNPIAERFEDLICWQLATRLCELVYALTDSGAVLNDRAFIDQIRDSSSSVGRNIAEGFNKFDPPEFGRYMNIAKGSLGETMNSLKQGRGKYYDEERFTEAWRIACRLTRASNRLHAYLRRCGKKKPEKAPNPENPKNPKNPKNLKNLKNPEEPNPEEPSRTTQNPGTSRNPWLFE
jgi:four helix bundle protein